MKLTIVICSLVLIGAHLAAATPSGYAARPFEEVLQKRQTQLTSLGRSVVDLGYSTYEGVQNTTSGLTTWKGIRYAAPPVGNLRWQAPQPPTYNRTQVIPANAFGPICPQSRQAGGSSGVFSSEDCLYLNVYAPTNATNLPIFIWIHGGGYGAGNGQTDLSLIVNTNNKSFIGIAIQYRLGAFGFLSSDEVFRDGAVNAGILDQTFALEWVQAYGSLFGGNTSQVTIGGESAGGGSVMLQDMAYGGTLGNRLFRNTFAASPYLPMQYGYKDWVPSQAYYAFAIHAGCPPTWAYGNASTTIFNCLISQNTTTLQNASFTVSSSGLYGTWGFLPVTDGVFIQDVPSQQLLRKRVNGQNALIGNNANEGTPFTPATIKTEDDLVAWIKRTFPLFSNSAISKVLLYYPTTNASTTGPLYATNGISGASALNQSQVATGQQQRADNIYAESTFVCPSYWMAEAYTDKGRTSYKYQYSVAAAIHGTDVSGYFGPAAITQGPDFEVAFMTILGRFVKTNNPSISAAIANGANSMNLQAPNAATNWPAFSVYSPYQINLNQTGGSTSFSTMGYGVNFTQLSGPGMMNNFSLVNAYTWEAGRGFRCDFWRSVAAIVPE